MYTNNKFFISIYGKDRKDTLLKLDNYISQDTILTDTPMCTYYVNNIYYTGLPNKPVNEDYVDLLLHGIIFPYNMTLDQFSEQPELYLKEMISKHRNDLSRLPYSIRNGSYCGVAYDETNDEFYAFTCFLNSIPLYYAIIDNCLIVGTDLILIAQLLGLELDLSQGLIEYYILGTNLSNMTAFDQIKTIPKGGYLKYKDGSISVNYYYTMPEEKPVKNCDEYVEEFAYLWEENVNALHSEKFNYGLGLTGGVDSRLILSAMKNKRKPILFTGSHPNHPDYLIAKKITSSLGLNNHYLEDYRFVDRLNGYAEFCSMADNPLLANTIYTSQQMHFRRGHNLIYELTGLSEFLGGVYHYLDRRDIFSTIKCSRPIKRTSINNIPFYKLIQLGLRNQTLDKDINLFDDKIIDGFAQIQILLPKIIIPQLGIYKDIETFLERFRHIHKMANLLTWSLLSKRRMNECISPSMNISMTNFACKIPLEIRDTRKIELLYLKKFHPETAKFVLSGYVFNANSPWFIYKGLSNYIKAFNAMGYKIPVLQWYIKRRSSTDFGNQPEILAFQKAICAKANIITETPLISIFQKYPNDPIRIMRLFNIALLYIRLEMGEDNLRDFLINEINYT